MADTLGDLTSAAMPSTIGSMGGSGGLFTSRLTGGVERWGNRMNSIMDTLLRKAEKFSKYMNTTAGGGGTGGVGSGNGMNLGLGGFSNAPSALTPRGLGMEAAMMGGMGLFKLAMAGGAYHYSMMPATADVMARNRLAFNSGLASSLSPNLIGRMSASMNGGRMTGVTDPYMTTAVLSMSGYGLSSRYGQTAFNTAANLGYLTGQSAPGVAQTLANNLMDPGMGTRLQMLGINNVNMKTGEPVGFQNMMDQLFNRLGFGKFKNVEQFNRELAAGYGGTNLNYYIPDPEMRSLAVQYFQSKYKGTMNLGGNAKGAIDAMGQGTLNAESAMRGYMGSETQKIEDFGTAVSEGATNAYKFAKSLNEALDPTAQWLQTIAKGKGFLDSFLGTSSGQGGLAAATLALGGLRDIANSVAMALGALAMAGGAGALLGRGGKPPAGGVAPGGAAAKPGAFTAGSAARGLGGGALGLVLGAPAVDWLDDQNYSWAPDGGVVDHAGRFFGYMGAGAAGGLMMGGPIGAVFGAVGGAAYGIYDRFTNPSGMSASQGSQVSVVPGGAGERSGGSTASGTSVTGSSVVNIAMNQVGTDYTAGGRSPDTGWDCAGFTYWVFKRLGIILPQVSWEQVKRGTPVASMADAKPGDLLFFHMPNGHSRDPGPMKINHVGIYAGKGKMVHASTPSSGTIKSDVYRNYLKAIRRVVNTSTLGRSAQDILSETLNITDAGGEGILSGSAGMQTSYTVSTSGVKFDSSSIGQALSSGIGGLPSYGATADPSNNRSESATTSGETGGPNSVRVTGKKGGVWLAQFLYNKGLRGDTLKRMWAIGMRESGGNPRIDNAGMNSNGSTDYGLFQINDDAHSSWVRQTFGWSMEDLRDPNKNFKVMWRMSQHGQNLGAWGVRNPDGSLSGWAANLSSSQVRHFESVMNSYIEKFDSYAHRANIPGYSQGAWNISRDHTARVHTGEMILTASVAEAVRRSTQEAFSGNRSGSAGQVVINVQLKNGGNAEAMNLARAVKQILNGSNTIDTIVST